MALATTTLTSNSATFESGGLNELFRHHGVWAPGIRLFRALQFQSKALIISAAFVLPILGLGWTLWVQTADSVAAARQELQTLARQTPLPDLAAAAAEAAGAGQRRAAVAPTSAELEARLQARVNHLHGTLAAPAGISLLFVLLGAYLFHAFFLVTHGDLREVQKHLEAITAGDLTSQPRPWGQDEVVRLMASLAAMQGSLRNIVNAVRGSSESIVHASSAIAAASMDLSARTEETAAKLEQSASSMHEISSTVKHTSDKVRDAAQVATDNSQAAARGGAVIADVVNTMHKINSSSKKIGDIIGTSVGQVDAGTRVVEGAGATLQALVANAQRMNNLRSEISTAATEQSAGVDQVGAAVDGLDRMTQQNAARVEQTAAAASALQDQALGLAAEVARFKLPASAF